MKDAEFERRVAYWTDDLVRENVRIAPVLDKLNLDLTSRLTPEDLYRIRVHLRETRSIGSLLHRDVVDHKFRDRKKSFLKRLLRK